MTKKELLMALEPFDDEAFLFMVAEMKDVLEMESECLKVVDTVEINRSGRKMIALIVD